MDWREAFEVNKHAVGRAVHEAWAAEKIKQGFADHVYSEGPRTGWVDVDGRHPCVCGQMLAKHHTDMLDYADLPPHIQEYDIQTGIVGFRMGYEAAQATDTTHAGHTAPKTPQGQSETGGAR